MIYKPDPHPSMHSYLHIFFSFIFLFPVVVCKAQTSTEKEQLHLPQHTSSLKIIFDDSNSQLIGIDTSGNVIENAIVAFQLFENIKGKSYSEQALGANLSKAMLDLLDKADPTTILYFEHIQIKNASGGLTEATNFQYNLGYLKKEK